MDPESSASLKVEWERTDKSLSDLLALGGQQQQSRVASAALEAQQQRFRLWAKVIGLQDDGVDSRLNTSEMKSLLRNSRLHIADATQPGKPSRRPSHVQICLRRIALYEVILSLDFILFSGFD